VEVISREAQLSAAGGILSRAIEIYRFAEEMNRDAEFRFFLGELSNLWLFTSKLMFHLKQFSTKIRIHTM